MPTSERLRAGLIALAGLALAACEATMTGPVQGSPSRTRVNVAGQAVTIAAPPGFCIDGKSTQVTANGAFVLMSDCALLGGASGDRPAVGAALTASVSTGGFAGEGDAAGSLDEIEEFAGTPEGRAVFGRSGQPERVRILSTQRQNDVLYLLIEDRGRLPIAGIDRQFWRAFLEVNGRMTALSVLGFSGAGVSAQDGLNQLAALAASIRAANPGA
jgi:hypothetical protein